MIRWPRSFASDLGMLTPGFDGAGAAAPELGAVRAAGRCSNRATHAAGNAAAAAGIAMMAAATAVHTFHRTFTIRRGS
jgi:hypothetical protein